MEKERRLVASLIVVSVICVILAVNAIAVNVQLNADKPKLVRLNTTITDLEAQLSDLTKKHEEQLNIARDLQGAINVAREEAQNIRSEADTLKATNTDLQAKLSAVSEAITGPSGVAEAEAK